mgnify:FL=1
MNKYIVTMIIDTDDGYPSDWDWDGLLGEHNVSYVMSHRLYHWQCKHLIEKEIDNE